jgi:hypothetical protein
MEHLHHPEDLVSLQGCRQTKSRLSSGGAEKSQKRVDWTLMDVQGVVVVVQPRHLPLLPRHQPQVSSQE